MRKFEESDIKEMLRYLNRQHSDFNGYVESVISDIDEWAYEHDLLNDIKTEAFLCEAEEIERGYWDWGGVDTVLAKDYDKKFFIIDIAYEDGGITIYVATPAEEPF